MIAFHGKEEIKNTYLSRVKAHALADEIIKGALDEGRIGTDSVSGVTYRFSGSKTIEHQTKNKAGYVVFTLHFSGKRIQAKAHRAIWIAANGILERNTVIDHINRNKSDNRLANLRLVTNKENAKNRRSYNGEQNPSAKITRMTANKIKTHHCSEFSDNLVEDKTKGISFSCLHCCYEYQPKKILHGWKSELSLRIEGPWQQAP